jgi:hypothetical protein
MKRKFFMNETELKEWFFQQLIKREDGCWEWPHCKTQKGYGQFRHNNKITFSHRYVLEKKLGRPIANKMMACHSCHNRACCNPEHIREGTAKENTQDMLSAGREARPELTVCLGEKHGLSKLTNEDVIEIRRLRGSVSVRQLARDYGVAPSQISSIQLRKTWKHVE